MNNILLISHDGFASGAKKAAELILGEQHNISILELTGEIGIENFKEELNKKIEQLINHNARLMILSDLKNGTPFNCALSIIATQNLWSNVFLLSGMNLNLILETIMASDAEISEEMPHEMILLAQSGIAEMNKTIWDKQLNLSEE